MKQLGVFALGVLCTVAAFSAEEHDYPIKPVPFSDFKISDGFWAPRMKAHKDATIPFSFKIMERTGRLGNFYKAAGLREGKYRGMFFNDSDVYKALEGVAYSLKIHPDKELEKKVDDLIDVFAKAQWDDGYLNAFFSLPEKKTEQRWKEFTKHELYCAGHFFEFAVAYYEATGKRKALDMAIKLADLIDSIFGPGKNTMPPGHQEIEIALARLYRATGEERYLKLAKFFLDVRGTKPSSGHYRGAYAQDHKPVLKQSEAIGHAVRAVYMYTAMADIAALTGDDSYIKAIDLLWEDVTYQKTYLTGGIGASHRGEAFGADYDLPNHSYAETCAAIGNAFWNHRLFLMRGDAKYMDIIERVIYNGFLAASFMDGGGTFYTNPLEDKRGRSRGKGWPGCACCPSNEQRFMPSIMGYIFAHRDDELFVNLFINGSTTVKLKSNSVAVSQKSNYPWDGKIDLTINPKKKGKFTLKIRIPGWARNQPLPGDLYKYINKTSAQPVLMVNDKKTDIVLDSGYAVLDRKWKAGDKVSLYLPMPVRQVFSHANVKENVGKVAYERGPIVYCAETMDNKDIGTSLFDLLVSDKAKLDSEYKADLLNGVTVITAQLEGDKNLTMIPYYSWAHRGASPMNIWFKREGEFKYDPKLAFKKSTDGKFAGVVASYTNPGDDIAVLMENANPNKSGDSDARRWTSWTQKGKDQWVVIDLGAAKKIKNIGIFWYDDGGGVKVPASWDVSTRATDNGEWRAMKPYLTDTFNTAKDMFNDVKPDTEPVARYVRINMKPQLNACVGIMAVNIDTE
ncbi:hypothetical protein BVX94_01180 [bacterium B17]|nr:hypothetical protein BVX94_01180 [bacterium B17]